MYEAAIVVYQVIILGMISIVRHHWRYVLVGLAGYQLGASFNKAPQLSVPTAVVRHSEAARTLAKARPLAVVPEHRAAETDGPAPGGGTEPLERR